MALFDLLFPTMCILFSSDMYCFDKKIDLCFCTSFYVQLKYDSWWGKILDNLVRRNIPEYEKN
jgi:hypothetical protein